MNIKILLSSILEFIYVNFKGNCWINRIYEVKDESMNSNKWETNAEVTRGKEVRIIRDIIYLISKVYRLRCYIYIILEGQEVGNID